MDCSVLGNNADGFLFLVGKDAANHRVAADFGIFTHDCVANNGAGFDCHTGHHHGVFYQCACADGAAGGDNAVLYRAVNFRALCNKAVYSSGFSVDVGGGKGVVSGVDLAAFVTAYVKGRLFAQKVHIGFP